MMDGGIRRGTDVLKALALGAKFVFVSRPFSYAAAIASELACATPSTSSRPRSTATWRCWHQSLDELSPRHLRIEAAVGLGLNQAPQRGGDRGLPAEARDTGTLAALYPCSPRP
jgi:hypothetical protein